MSKKFLFILLIFNVIKLQSQSHFIHIQSKDQMNGYFILKDIRSTSTDTIIFRQLIGNSVNISYSLPPGKDKATVTPLVFELNGVGQSNYSGMLITDDLEINIEQVNDDKQITIQGSAVNNWYYQLEDSLNYYLSNLEKFDEIAREKVVNLLCNDTTAGREEVYGIFLFQLLANGFLTAQYIPRAITFISKFPEGYWTEKTLDLIYQQQGKPLKEIELIDNKGRKFTLTELHKKRFLLIDFWASWCSPCLAAIPKLKTLHESHESDLTIVSISIDKNSKSWLTVNTKLNLPWYSFLDHSDLNKKLEYFLNITSIPTILLFDHDWNLLYRGNDVNVIQETIKP